MGLLLAKARRFPPCHMYFAYNSIRNKQHSNNINTQFASWTLFPLSHASYFIAAFSSVREITTTIETLTPLWWLLPMSPSFVIGRWMRKNERSHSPILLHFHRIRLCFPLQQIYLCICTISSAVRAHIGRQAPHCGVNSLSADQIARGIDRMLYQHATCAESSIENDKRHTK